MGNHFAVLVDLENAGGKVSTLASVIDQVKLKGDILLSRAYGYTPAYENLKEMLLSNTFYVVPSLRYGCQQKNHMDIQLVIDALEVAYTNDRIDSFCIVSGDSDYTPLVGKLKSMGKYVLGISRSETASSIFINACSEFLFLESVSSMPEPAPQEDSLETITDMLVKILDEQSGGGDTHYASELKTTLIRLKPDFNERNYGFSSFGRLLQKAAKKDKRIQLENQGYSVKVHLAGEQTDAGLTGESWKKAMIGVLAELKDKGFERVNPSIVKALVQQKYPAFDERDIGFKKFSDVMKCLEREKLVQVELDEQRSMLIKII